MSKGRLKAVLIEKGVNVTPIYKLVEQKDGSFAKMSPNSKEEGVMHYRAEPKRKTF